MAIWRNDILDRYKLETALANLIIEVERNEAEFEKNISGIT